MLQLFTLKQVEAGLLKPFPARGRQTFHKADVFQGQAGIDNLPVHRAEAPFLMGQDFRSQVLRSGEVSPAFLQTGQALQGLDHVRVRVPE